MQPGLLILSLLGALAADAAVSSVFGRAIQQRLQDRGAGQPAARDTDCSRTCVCSDGGILPYGKYCGLDYSGCHGEAPCDGVDACCKTHDWCCTAESLESCDCHTALIKCLLCAERRVLLAGRGSGGGGAHPPANWTCAGAATAAARFVADLRILVPECYERAVQESAAAAALNIIS